MFSTRRPGRRNGHVHLVAVQGDITRQRVDAVVNAAHHRLTGGGGVDGAIHLAAGPRLLRACMKLEWCETGEARITRGYRLKAKHVIHAVGPKWRGGERGEPELLARTYRSALALAEEHRCRSVAFPAISCGAYGFPEEPATRIAVESIRDALAGDGWVERVVFALPDEDIHAVYLEILGSRKAVDSASQGPAART